VIATRKQRAAHHPYTRKIKTHFSNITLRRERGQSINKLPSLLARKSSNNNDTASIS
jgi:hypothetical protein